MEEASNEPNGPPWTGEGPVRLVKTGIEGLDELLGGGFDEGSVILLAGPHGSGKTILAAQFIYNGVVKCNEVGIYISFSESKSDFFRNMLRLGMDFSRLEKEGKFRFIDALNVLDRRALDLVFSHILEELSAIDFKRMVVDSLTAIERIIDPGELRAFITATIIGICKINKITGLLIGDVIPESPNGVNSEVSFMADAVLVLEAQRLGEVTQRFLRVEKVRGRRTTYSKVEYVITDRGIVMHTPVRSLAAVKLDGDVGIGVPDFDRKILMGGVKRGTITLISGPVGTGKKVILAEFAVSGVLNGERVLYVTYRDAVDEVRRFFSDLGHDVEELEKKGLRIVYIDPSRNTPGRNYLALKEAYEAHRPDRVVIDEISIMDWLPRGEYVRLLNDMISFFKSKGATVMMSASVDLTKGMDNEVAKVVDNVIAMWVERERGSMDRRICTLKMKGKAHDDKIRRIEYKEGGIEVKDLDIY